MVYRKLDLRIHPAIWRQLRAAFSPGARALLFEELEIFSGTENKSFYRSKIEEGVIVYEIGVGGFLLAQVTVEDDAVYLLSVEALF
jgi:hypothetical protein